MVSADFSVTNKDTNPYSSLRWQASRQMGLCIDPSVLHSDLSFLHDTKSANYSIVLGFARATTPKP